MTRYDFVGIDVAKNKFDVALLNDEQCAKKKQFYRTEQGVASFIAWLNKHTHNPSVCMESTGLYSEFIAEVLFENKITCSIVNPYQIKHFSRVSLARNKNDYLDAEVIASFNQKMQPKPFKPRGKISKKLRELMRLHGSLVSKKTSLKVEKTAAMLEEVQKLYCSIIKKLEIQLEMLEKRMNRLIESDSTLSKKQELLLSIPGIGIKTVYAIFAFLPDIALFDNAKALAAFIGVSPMQKQSGQCIGQTKMCKFGDSRMRRALYMPACSVKNYRKGFSSFVTRLEEKGLAPKQILGAIMRKLAHIIYGVLTNEKPFDPKLACKA